MNTEYQLEGITILSSTGWRDIISKIVSSFVRKVAKMLIMEELRLETMEGN